VESRESELVVGLPALGVTSIAVGLVRGAPFATRVEPEA
jgi:hypothetical protein